MTRDIYTKMTTNKQTKSNEEKNVFIDVCLPACLFIHSLIYYLEVAL